MARTIRLIDVTLRDAHQCLWATRMTTAMMKDIAPRLDAAGFEAIDLVQLLSGEYRLPAASDIPPHL